MVLNPRPSITPQSLIAALINQNVLSSEDLISLLGPERHDPPIALLERSIVKNGILSDRELLELKGRCAQQPTTTPETVGIPVLPAPLARQLGSVAIAGSAPRVAMIEDLPNYVERIQAELGSDTHFEVVLTTATQFVTLLNQAYGDGAKEEHRPETGNILELLDQAIGLEASDIHLSVGYPPVLRINSALTELHYRPLTNNWLRQEIVRLLGEDVLPQIFATHNLDAAYSYGPVRFRINIGGDKAGLTMALRRLPSRLLSYDELRLPPSAQAFAELERGLVLVTGPTGSGKSTTLASMLAHIAATRPVHMITLEDPIEYILPTKRAVIHQRELGQSFTAFDQGLVQALRQDPDVILVGEARDTATIRAAVTAAETGALVFATVHTYDAVSTLGRIISTYPQGEQEQARSQLAYILKGVISQTLVPAVTGGRVAAYEVLVGNSAVANNLRQPDGLLSLRQVIDTAPKDVMQTLEQDLARLVRNRTVTEEEARFRARYVDDYERALHSLGG